MALELQVSRKQQIISRVIIAFLVLGILANLCVLHFAHTKAVKTGDITTYTSPISLFFSAEFGFLGLVACVMGVFYGRQRHIFFRMAGVAIFLTGLFCLFNAPTGLNHKVVVTPDYFSQRIGSWYSPAETKIEFTTVKYMDIDENDATRGKGLKYVLRCEGNGKTDEVRIEINDLLKAALPEIYHRAADRDVLIGDSPDGRPIPSDL
jgi:hypothetical protein